MRKACRVFYAAALALLTPLVGQAGADSTRYQTEAFDTTYTIGGSTYRIAGYRPRAAGSFPVYVHIGGTGESYTSLWAGAAAEAAAERGFVAASVEYPNSSFGDCSVIGARARAIFDSSSAVSAISRLCASDKADCSKGVVTGGLSQGSIISVLSHDYDNRVRASFGQGTGSTYTSAYDLSACIANGKHTQSGDRVRVINGEHDMFVGGNQSIAASQASLVTGASCPEGKQSCFRDNGSGWYIVKDNEVQDGYADHCFMGYGGTPAYQCSGPYVDQNYASGYKGWELNPTIDWVTKFASR